MLNRRHREALKLGLKGEDIYKYIYGENINFGNIPNGIDVISTDLEDECTIHLHGTNFVFNLLDLIKNIYRIFGYESIVLREYIEKELKEIYGNVYDIKDVLR